MVDDVDVDRIQEAEPNDVDLSMVDIVDFEEGSDPGLEEIVITVTESKYGGKLEGANWLAFAQPPFDVPADAFGDVLVAATWWNKNRQLVGRGANPNVAVRHLQAILARLPRDWPSPNSKSFYEPVSDDTRNISEGADNTIEWGYLDPAEQEMILSGEVDLDDHPEIKAPIGVLARNRAQKAPQVVRRALDEGKARSPEIIATIKGWFSKDR